MSAKASPGALRRLEAELATLPGPATSSGDPGASGTGEQSCSPITVSGGGGGSRRGDVGSASASGLSLPFEQLASFYDTCMRSPAAHGSAGAGSGGGGGAGAEVGAGHRRTAAQGTREPVPPARVRGLACWSHGVSAHLPPGLQAAVVSTDWFTAPGAGSAAGGGGLGVMSPDWSIAPDSAGRWRGPAGAGAGAAHESGPGGASGVRAVLSGSRAGCVARPLHSRAESLMRACDCARSYDAEGEADADHFLDQFLDGMDRDDAMV